jgi:hypothetical protein
MPGYGCKLRRNIQRMATDVLDQGPARWWKGEQCSLGSLPVVSKKPDDLEKNFELVGVMIFRCLTQVGRNCEDTAVFGIAMRQLQSWFVMYFHGTKAIFVR